VTPLNPPLGLVSPIPPKQHRLAETANLSPIAALAKGIGYAAAHQDCAFGSGALEVARYGHVLQARALVGVRGAGLAYDGLYFVTKVTHDIRRGGYTQQFSLARNGLISTVPAVPA
jgi:hypothetical protein